MQREENEHKQAQTHAAYQCNLCSRSFPTNHGLPTNHGQLNHCQLRKCKTMLASMLIQPQKIFQQRTLAVEYGEIIQQKIFIKI